MAGKVVLVTGASSGIGLVASKCFAERGLKVVLTARRTSMLETAVLEITEAGGAAVSFKLDVTKEEDHQAAFEFAEKTYGRVDYVFANAGCVGPVKPMENQTLEEIMRPMNINLQGVVLSVKYAVASMRKNQSGGAIVVNSSVTSVVSRGYYKSAGTWNIPYVMSKSAADALVRGMTAYEKEDIRGYGINPCVYETEMTSRNPDVAPSDLAGAANPIFNDIVTPWLSYPEGSAKLALVVLSMFDGTTKYKPGDSVLCDGDATWNAQIAHNNISHETKGLPSKKTLIENMRDYKGDPYDIAKLPKMPEKQAEEGAERQTEDNLTGNN